MKKVLLPLAGLLIAGALQAQYIPGSLDRLYRTYYGCDDRGSCVWLTMRHTSGDEHFSGYDGDAAWKAKFTSPARVYTFLIDSRYPDYFGGWPLDSFDLHQQGIDPGVGFRNPRPGPWRPQWATAIIQYEDEYEFGKPDRIIALTATPEPASLILLGSGLAALAGLGRRRRARPS